MNITVILYTPNSSYPSSGPSVIEEEYSLSGGDPQWVVFETVMFGDYRAEVRKVIPPDADITGAGEAVLTDKVYHLSTVGVEQP